MRISNEQSREIYELAKDPKNTLTNEAIGKRFGIDEATVRYHVKKWERELHSIAKSNSRIANALADHTVNVNIEAKEILSAVKNSIEEAKSNGVSPEKLSGLYGNWIKSLELVSELIGDINRAPQVNVQVNQQFNEFMNVILAEVNEVDRARIISKLKQSAIY